MAMAFPATLTLYVPLGARPVTMAVCTPPGAGSVVATDELAAFTGNQTAVAPNTAPSKGVPLEL
jgi:hypothetical protein